VSVVELSKLRIERFYDAANVRQQLGHRRHCIDLGELHQFVDPRLIGRRFLSHPHRHSDNEFLSRFERGAAWRFIAFFQR
jgi:hypothetical protein